MSKYGNGVQSDVFLDTKTELRKAVVKSRKNSAKLESSLQAHFQQIPLKETDREFKTGMMCRLAA